MVDVGERVRGEGLMRLNLGLFQPWEHDTLYHILGSLQWRIEHHKTSDNLRLIIGVLASLELDFAVFPIFSLF